MLGPTGKDKIFTQAGNKNVHTNRFDGFGKNGNILGATPSLHIRRGIFSPFVLPGKTHGSETRILIASRERKGRNAKRERERTMLGITVLA